jgi:tetratricopeptide (TPR) repeat protein
VRAGSNPREALAMQQRANESSRGPSGSDGRPTISGLILEGAYLYDLARYDEARGAYQDAQDLAERHRVPFFVAVARLGVAAAHRGAGDLARAREALRESEAAVAAQPPEDLLHAYLSLEQGRLALAQGELASARQRLVESLRTYEKVGRTRRSRIDALLALSELALRSGRTAEAEAHARAALAQAELLRGTSPHSGWSGRSQLALGGVYAARGDLAAARRLLTEAVAHMTETLGEGHPATRQAKSWLARHPPGSNG